MFQNFANYLLGSVINQNQDEAAEEVIDANNIRLRTSDEHDWVLVDRDSEGNSDACSISSVEEEQDDTFQRVYLTRSSSESSMPCPSSMDESWFVTPPPCFTSTGPAGMRTSPLENLLIEHPSMSVYHFHSSRRHFPPALLAAREASEVSITWEEEAAGAALAEAAENVRRQELAVEERLPRLPCTPILQDVQQHLLSKRAQKMQIQRAYKQMNRSNLERINKAREVNSRNQRQRRGQRSQGANRSHANNNRKC